LGHVSESFNGSTQPVGRLPACSYQEHPMSMNKDQIKGRANEVDGKIKEVTGKVVGDKKLEVKGNVQGSVGHAQNKLGDIKQDAKNLSK
jgi:uncharacterized protein YjbJ (UPF0337 family)